MKQQLTLTLMVTLALTTSVKSAWSQQSTSVLPITGQGSPSPVPPDYEVWSVRRVLTPEQAQHEEQLRAEFVRLQREAEELYSSGKFTEAESVAQKTIKAAPVIDGRKEEPSFTYHLLGNIYLMQGRYTEALKRLVPLTPNMMSNTLLQSIALCYAHFGNYDQAKETYFTYLRQRYHTDEEIKKHLRPLPGIANLQRLEATLLYECGIAAGRKAVSFLFLKEALRLSSNNGLIAYTIGERFRDQEKWKEALPYFETAIRYGGNNWYVQDAKESRDAWQAWQRVEAERARQALPETQPN